jgi:CPA2 family monovalent cation:H+ antiporter-2
MLPFREAFAAIFFVSLGLLFNVQLLWEEPLFVAAALAALIVLKWTAATIALKLTGLSWRVAGGTGLGLAHVGEFAFVVVLQGADSGVIDTLDYQRIVVLAIGSLTVTPLLLKTGLRWAEVPGEDEGLHVPRGDRPLRHALVIGAGPIGRQVSSHLEATGHDVCVVDLSPVNLHLFAQHGFRTVAGDAREVEVLSHAHASDASVAIVCVPDDHTAMRVVGLLRSINPDCLLLVRCRYFANMPKLERQGANFVVSEEAQASRALLEVLSRRESQRSSATA